MVKKSRFKGEGVDRWMWKLDSLGVYSVKTAYKGLRSYITNGTDAFFDNLWCGEVPLKIKAFVWKLVQDQIPSLNNLSRRNVNVQSLLCKGCEREVESAAHLFFECEVFSKVWYECMKWWGLMAPMHNDCKTHFWHFSRLLVGSKEQIETWETIWFAAVWVIWGARNACVFKGKNVDTGELVEQIKLKSWLWLSGKSPKFNYPVFCWFSNPLGCVGLVQGN